MKNSDVIIGYIRITSIFKEISHGLLWVDTDNRYIIPMKSLGFLQTPQDIMEEYNGRSVPQYTAYPLLMMAINLSLNHSTKVCAGYPNIGH
jgi:hypothetical protein